MGVVPLWPRVLSEVLIFEAFCAAAPMWSLTRPLRLAVGLGQLRGGRRRFCLIFQAGLGSAQHKENPLLPQSDAPALKSPTVTVKRQMAQFSSLFPACFATVESWNKCDYSDRGLLECSLRKSVKSGSSRAHIPACLKAWILPTWQFSVLTRH